MICLRDVRGASFIPVVLAALPLVLWSEVDAATDRIPCPLVVTQVPLDAGDATGRSWPLGSERPAWPEGSRLVVVDPDGQLRLLSSGFVAACDPNVSFDGQHVLFAGKKQSHAPWQIWEIAKDGSGLRAVTPEHLDARQPIYAATLFTLESPEPWAALVFAARERFVNEFGQVAASALYNLKLDGTDLRRLTFNPNQNMDPFQMWDGRIIYAAERYPTHPGAQPHVGLYAIHVEGADMERYGGELGKPVQTMPCATEFGLVVFVEADTAAEGGAGQLACVEERRPHVTYRPLTCDPEFLFANPAPLSGAQILVSRRTAGERGNWGIYRFDTQEKRCDPLFDTAQYHEVQAVALEPRTAPDGHSTVVDTQVQTGLFYGLNSYDSDARLAPHLAPGTIKRVRLIEGVPQSATEPNPGERRPFVPRRLVGEAPVESDGSFNVEVPADLPLLLQTLDEHGLALATCGWIWVKPKEKRGCVGCHEDPERVPENQYVLSLRRPSNRLVLPPSERRAVTFREVVGPILQRHCASADCHGGQDTPLQLASSNATPSEDALEESYTKLLAAESDGRGTIPRGRYVDPGQARTSWLVWQLMGRDVSRPWDARASALETGKKVRQMPPPGKGEALSAEEVRTVIQWIDLGAQYRAPRESSANLNPVSP